MGPNLQSMYTFDIEFDHYQNALKGIHNISIMGYQLSQSFGVKIPIILFLWSFTKHFAFYSVCGLGYFFLLKDKSCYDQLSAAV